MTHKNTLPFARPIGLPSARVFPLPHFIFKGPLVDPRLRASNEHILIVRVPRAGGRPGDPSHPSEAARCANIEDHQAPSPLHSVSKGDDLAGRRLDREGVF